MMNSRKILFPVVLSLLITFPAFAQQTDIPRDDIIRTIASTNDVLRTFNTRDVQGSPYFDNDFTLGRVFLDNGIRTVPVYLRINTLNNSVEFKKNSTDQDIYLADPQKIKKVELISPAKGNTIFVNGFPSEEHKITKDQLFKVLYDGSFKVLAHHRSDMIEAQSADISTGKRIDKIVNNVDHYLYINGKLHKIKLRYNDFAEHLQLSGDRLKAYAKENGLEFDREEDLNEIFTYYKEHIQN